MLEGLIPTVIVLVMSVAAIFGGHLFFRRQVGTSIGAEKDLLDQGIAKVNRELKDLRAYSDYFTSKAQLESIQASQTEARGEIDKAKATLKETETKLETAQKNVDEKEAKQQAVKAAKEGEQARLEQLKAGFESTSSESIELEKRLAQSLKELDEIIGELTLTQAQKEILNGLSQALTNAGSRLRDLIGEHSSVNDRLETLKQQHLDLEDEYTKLVEQQLGG